MNHLTFRHMHKVALAHPCLLEVEVAHPRFLRRVPGLGTVKLTIDSGYE